MTEVAFHFNAPDKLAYVCRLARKATRHDMRVLITASRQDLQRLDRLLWALGPSDFVAHCMDDADEEMRQAQRCCWQLTRWSCDPRDLLVNLGDAVPQASSNLPGWWRWSASQIQPTAAARASAGATTPPKAMRLFGMTWCCEGD